MAGLRGAGRLRSAIGRQFHRQRYAKIAMWRYRLFDQCGKRRVVERLRGRQFGDFGEDLATAPRLLAQ